MCNFRPRIWNSSSISEGIPPPRQAARTVKRLVCSISDCIGDRRLYASGPRQEAGSGNSRVKSYCRSVGTSTQFLTWYDDFNSQRVRNKIAVSVFEDGIKLINSIPESEAGPLKAIGKKLSTAAAHRQRSH